MDPMTVAIGVACVCLVYAVVSRVEEERRLRADERAFNEPLEDYDDGYDYDDDEDDDA